MAGGKHYLVKNTRHVLLAVLVLVSFLSMACCQRKLAVPGHARSTKGCVLLQSQARHWAAVSEHEAQKPLDVKDDDLDHADADADPAELSGDDGDHHDQAAPDDDNDFYRQYGDVPSPGIGH